MVRIHWIAPKPSILVFNKQCPTKKIKLKKNDKSRAWLSDWARAQTRQIADKNAIYKKRLHLNGTRILSLRIVPWNPSTNKNKTATRIVSTSRSDASFISQKEDTAFDMPHSIFFITDHRFLPLWFFRCHFMSGAKSEITILLSFGPQYILCYIL